jgi:hypothetical protein
MNQQPLRVALIVDTTTVPDHVYAFMQWAGSQAGVTLSHLIVQGGGHAELADGRARNLHNRGRIAVILRRACFDLVVKAEDRLLARSPLFKDHLKTHDIANTLACLHLSAPKISSCGTELSYADEDIEKIKSLGLDLLIYYGSGMLRGEVLTASTFGVLRVCYGDKNQDQTEPPGFWEVYYRKDATAFAIRRLANDAENAKVLTTGQFPTKFFYLLNQAALYKKSNAHLMRLVAEIAQTRKLPSEAEYVRHHRAVAGIPGLSVQARYTWDRSAAIAYKLVTRLLLRRYYRWGFAFSRNDWKSVVLGQSNRVENPPNHFLADPFVIREGDRDFCFVEDYDYSRRLGHIAVYEFKGNHAEPVGNAIVEPFHMSFPYLFRFGGKLYMCPETNQKKEIRIYECVKFPLEWRLAKVLMDGISAVDTMIFEKGGTWWLFTNIDPANADDNCSELFIFSSDDPVNGSWEPHRRNPVFINSAKARNAGLLFDGDDVYRVAQKQAFDMYGHGFSINKIIALDKEQYIESEVRAVRPNFFPDLKGTHHMHSNGNVSVFDYVKHMAVGK